MEIPTISLSGKVWPSAIEKVANLFKWTEQLDWLFWYLVLAVIILLSLWIQ
jgi:hypothetical protein